MQMTIENLILVQDLPARKAREQLLGMGAIDPQTYEHGGFRITKSVDPVAVGQWEYHVSVSRIPTRTGMNSTPAPSGIARLYAALIFPEVKRWGNTNQMTFAMHVWAPFGQ